MLKIDFYESGIGETTVITFPDGSIGILDAFPSDCVSRPDILSITEGKKINFVCLSHPHDDHARDLSSIIVERKPLAFWNTVQAPADFFYGLTECNKYKSSVSSYSEKRRLEAVESLIRLFSAAAERKITQQKISSTQKEIQIAGVDIFFLAPDNKTLSCYEYSLRRWNSGQSNSPPDPNRISSVIAFRYGDAVFLHGGDAVAQQWIRVFDEFFKNDLPLSVLMKIPHHGAENSLFRSSSSGMISNRNYIKLFKSDAHLVIFGNNTHPNPVVWHKLRCKSQNIFFLLNRYRPQKINNPLNIPGGRLKSNFGQKITCNSIIHAEINERGEVTVFPGKSCRECEKQRDCVPENNTI